MILMWFAVYPFIIPVIAKTFMFAQIIITDNNNCHECWLAHSDYRAVDCKTHYDFMNVKYVKTLCLGINEVVLTSLFMANRIFPCVLTLCFLLN